VELFFTYLEINPLVVSQDGQQIHILDLAAKIDATAEFACRSKWGDALEFPPPFGRDLLPEVRFTNYIFFYIDSNFFDFFFRSNSSRIWIRKAARR
jgi:hypothetical protein